MTKPTVLDSLTQQGVSRRSFLKFCAISASMLALPVDKVVAALAATPMPSIIWLHFQECTGCTESLTRSFDPTLESLILSRVSLDYHETLMAAAGDQAEQARTDAMKANYGKYILVVEGALPKTGFAAKGGRDAIAILNEAVAGAALVVAVGACASFGGLPKAFSPLPGGVSPSGAQGVSDLMKAGKVPNKTLINVPGCPPIPEVMSGVLVYYLVNKKAPALDSNLRPKLFYGETVHDECPREDFYEDGQFALTFDDEGARKGWCLLKLGCRGPKTHNACTKIRWNQGVSYPIRSGHGCLGCAEPDFWNRKNSSGAYASIYALVSGGGDGDCGGGDGGGDDDHDHD
ncbi:MAG: hydrogenase small subunit [Candidatus Competibacteraceae bacterium]